MRMLGGLVLIVAGLSNTAYSQERKEDHDFLVGLVQQARNYFEGGVDCNPEFNFDDRIELVQEFLTITNEEVKDVISRRENEITIFLERRKSGRPGLTLDVTLKNGECHEFYIFELMH